MHDITAWYYCNPYNIVSTEYFIFGRKPVGEEWGYSTEIVVHLTPDIEYVGDECFYGFTVGGKPVDGIVLWRNPRKPDDVRPQLISDDYWPTLRWSFKD